MQRVLLVQREPLGPQGPQALLELPGFQVLPESQAQPGLMVQPEPYHLALADHLPEVLAEASQRNQPLSECLPE